MNNEDLQHCSKYNGYVKRQFKASKNVIFPFFYSTYFVKDHTIKTIELWKVRRKVVKEFKFDTCQWVYGSFPELILGHAPTFTLRNRIIRDRLLRLLSFTTTTNRQDHIDYIDP